jgi:acetyl esterase/lipase
MCCVNNYKQLHILIIHTTGLGLKSFTDFRNERHFSTYKRLVLMFLVFFSVLTLSISQTLTPTFSNVDYVGKNNEHQKMDIYIPAGLNTPAPIIVFIHGGGWLSGAKGADNVPFFYQCYTSGFICADINYRLSADSVWPAQIEDCKTAIRFLKTNAQTYNIDICRFGLMGESAGGHLSSMVGTTAGVKAFEGLHQGYTSQTSRVQAVVDIYGPTDFLKEDGYYPVSCGTGGLVHEYNSYETLLLGIDKLHNYQALVNTANPISYITSDDARFFIIHGEDDCTVPPYQSKILDSALRVANVPADTLIIATGQNHGSPYFKDYIRTKLYSDFFLKHLSSPCSIVGVSRTILHNISVFPNPATTEIKIDLPLKSNFTIELINTSGKIILKARDQNIINISHIKSGIYYLKLIYPKTIYTQKLVKL